MIHRLGRPPAGQRPPGRRSRSLEGSPYNQSFLGLYSNPPQKKNKKIEQARCWKLSLSITVYLVNLGWDLMLLSFWGSPKCHGWGVELYWLAHWGLTWFNRGILGSPLWWASSEPFYLVIYLYYLFNSLNVIKLNMNPKYGWTWGLEDVFPWFFPLFFLNIATLMVASSPGVCQLSASNQQTLAPMTTTSTSSLPLASLARAAKTFRRNLAGCHWKNGGFFRWGLRGPRNLDPKIFFWEKQLWNVVKRCFDDIHMNKGIYIYIYHIIIHIDKFWVWSRASEIQMNYSSKAHEGIWGVRIWERFWPNKHPCPWQFARVWTPDFWNSGVAHGYSQATCLHKRPCAARI